MFYFANQQESQFVKKSNFKYWKRYFTEAKEISVEDSEEKSKIYLASIMFEGEEFPFEFGVRQRRRNQFGLEVELVFVFRRKEITDEYKEMIERLFGPGKVKVTEGYWEFQQRNRRILLESVLPFYRKYKLPYTSGRYDEAFSVCGEILGQLKEGEHHSREGLERILRIGCEHQAGVLKGKGRRVKPYEHWVKILTDFEK